MRVTCPLYKPFLSFSSVLELSKLFGINSNGAVMTLLLPMYCPGICTSCRSYPARVRSRGKVIMLGTGRPLSARKWAWPVLIEVGGACTLLEVSCNYYFVLFWPRIGRNQQDTLLGTTKKRYAEKIVCLHGLIPSTESSFLPTTSIQMANSCVGLLEALQKVHNAIQNEALKCKPSAHS